MLLTDEGGKRGRRRGCREVLSERGWVSKREGGERRREGRGGEGGEEGGRDPFAFLRLKMVRWARLNHIKETSRASLIQRANEEARREFFRPPELPNGHAPSLLLAENEVNRAFWFCFGTLLLRSLLLNLWLQPSSKPP